MPWSLYHANLIVHLSFTMTLYTWNVLLLITLFKFHLILFNAFENQLFCAIFRLQAVNNRKCNHLSHKATPQCQSFLFFKNSSTSFSWCKLYLNFSHQLNQPADSLERTVQSLVFQLQTIFSTFYVSICVFLASILDVELFFSGISCYRLLIKLVVIPSTSNNTTLTKVFPQQIFLILTPPVLFLAYQLLFLLSPSINLFPTITTFSPCTLCARISSCIRRFFFFSSFIPEVSFYGLTTSQYFYLDTIFTWVVNQGWRPPSSHNARIFPAFQSGISWLWEWEW